MKINIYYGGRGLLDDPTLYVINKMQEVLEELRVTVERYNLYELKNGITTLPQTLKDVDGMILARLLCQPHMENGKARQRWHLRGKY